MVKSYAEIDIPLEYIKFIFMATEAKQKYMHLPDGSVKYRMTVIDIDVVFHPFIVFDSISTHFFVKVYFK